MKWRISLIIFLSLSVPRILMPFEPSLECHADSLNMRLISNLIYDSTGVYAEGIAVDGTLAYIADWSGLVILSIEDPSSPSLIGTCDLERGAYDVEVSYPYAYVPALLMGLQVISVLDAENPRIVGGFGDFDRSEDVLVIGDKLFLPVYGEGLYILSLENPESPAEISLYEPATRDLAQSVTVYDNFAFLSIDYQGGEGAVEIADISDLSNPTFVSAISSVRTPWDIGVIAPHAFVADEGGLRVLSILDIYNPIEVCYYEPGWECHDLEMVGNLAFLAAYSGGVRVLSVADPENPVEVGFYDTPGQALDISVSNELVYVADQFGGLTILEYYGPTSITGFDDAGSSVPKNYSLQQNYPNPFNPSTTIAFNVPGTSVLKHHVSLTVYDIRGKRRKVLLDSLLGPGTHEVLWDGRDDQGAHVPSGAYLYILRAGDITLTRKMTALK
jgi:hypothetical protein